MLSQVAAPFTQRLRPVAWDSDLGSRIDSKSMASGFAIFVLLVAEVLPRKERSWPVDYFRHLRAYFLFLNADVFPS
jgi:hypothetical protein